MSNNSQLVKTQYATSANLEARIAVHRLFSTATRNLHDWLFDFAAASPNARVLELGCGSGEMWRTVQGRVPSSWRIALTDFSVGMATRCKGEIGSSQTGVASSSQTGVASSSQMGAASLPQMGAASSSQMGAASLPQMGAETAPLRVAFAQCDAQAIPFDDETFELVFANYMLYHVPDLPRALGEIRRVLKAGGALIAATNGEGHMRELRELQRAAGIERIWQGLTFTLENGAAWLAPHFASVVRHDFDDGLRVTQGEPLIAYALSSSDISQMTEAQLARLRALVSEQLAREGVIEIQKATGIFVARK